MDKKVSKSVEVKVMDGSNMRDSGSVQGHKHLTERQNLASDSVGLRSNHFCGTRKRSSRAATYCKSGVSNPRSGDRCWFVVFVDWDTVKTKTEWKSV